MAIPAGIATVVVSGRYIRPDGSPLTGTITFEPPARLTFPDADTISAGAATVALDTEGAFTLELIATDVPGMQPEGWTYTVTERVAKAPERTYYIALPAATSSVNLADIAPADPAHGDYVLITGPAGRDGTQIHSGSGDPSATVGADGDFYIDTTPGAPALLGPKAAGTWPSSGVSLGGGNAKGVYIPREWGEFWRPKRDVAASSGARVVVAGDSLSQGYFASNLHTTSWVGLARQELQATYGNGGSGFFSSSRSDVVMSAQATALNAWRANGSIATLTGTWTLGTLNFGPGITFIQAAAAATATFKVTGSTVKIYNIGGAAPRAGYTYSIDGAAPVAVPASIGSTSVQVTTVGGLTATDHTVTIAWNGAADEILYLVGVAGENSSGVIVDNLARAGTRSSHWATGHVLNSAWNGGASYPADLVVCSLGLNDAANTVTGPDWLANMGTYLRAVRAAHNGATDILLILHHVGNYGSTSGAAAYHTYASQIRGIADTYGAALINLWAMGRNSWDYWNALGYWGNGATPGPAGTDLVHVSDAGHAFIADQVIPVLMS